MTDQERFQAFIDGCDWKCKTFRVAGITDYDTIICFSYCDLRFSEGTLVSATRCGGRPREHEEKTIK